MMWEVRNKEINPLIKEFGRGFYQEYPIQQTLSVRELKRQINTSLFERILLSEGKANKETVLALSKKGIDILKAEDILKDPYVFEFLGMPENKPMMENDLEKALVKHIEKFLLELGNGFMFVGTQQRVTLNNNHYYVDMVFYNKILRSYVLIELKTSKLMPEVVGQLNMYLNYYWRMAWRSIIAGHYFFKFYLKIIISYVWWREVQGVKAPSPRYRVSPRPFRNGNKFKIKMFYRRKYL